MKYLILILASFCLASCVVKPEDVRAGFETIKAKQNNIIQYRQKNPEMYEFVVRESDNSIWKYIVSDNNWVNPKTGQLNWTLHSRELLLSSPPDLNNNINNQ